MIPTYSDKIVLRAEHVDFKRNLRMDVLFRLFQEAAIAHTEELGMGRSKTLDRGFLWVIASERVLVRRLPKYDEEIELISYPGSTLHYFFPRHYIVRSLSGEILIEGNAIWTLIDEKSRELIEPKANKIKIEGGEKGNELPSVMAIPMPPLTKSFKGSAKYSLVDLNGHLNNASYVNICLDSIGLEEMKNKTVKEIAILFRREIPMGTEFEVSYEQQRNIYYFKNDFFHCKVVLEEDQ